MGYTLITGASGGIGLDMADIYASKKNDLILVARSEDKLNSLAEKLINDHQVKVKVYKCDLSEIEQTKSLCLKIQEDQLEVSRLVNNAGVGRFGKVVDDSVDGILNMMHLNMDSLVYLCHFYGKKMKESGRGEILNVASIAAFFPGVYMNAYYASKAFVLHFSEALFEEMKGTGVHVSALCPGPVRTDFFTRNSLEKVARLDDAPFVQDSRTVALSGVKGLENKKVVIFSGKAACFFANLSRFLPRFLLRYGTKKLNKG